MQLLYRDDVLGLQPRPKQVPDQEVAMLRSCCSQLLLQEVKQQLADLKAQVDRLESLLRQATSDKLKK